MCARFQTPAQAAAERYWKLIEPLWRYDESWRVLPTDPVPVVLTLNGERTGRMMRWGLIPFTGDSKFPLINATVEKLETWYAWKGPWERGQRCLLSMAGFYEPHRYEDGRKEPFYVHLADRAIFGVAGLWDRSRDHQGNEILSCTLITTPPNSVMASVHNEKQRMPAVLREEDHEAWLLGSAAEARSTLVPYPDDLMVAWQVSRRLYAIRTPNDASLIEPVASGGATAGRSG
jgi:putative SOS response-associated peptidase YedK